MGCGCAGGGGGGGRGRGRPTRRCGDEETRKNWCESYRPLIALKSRSATRWASLRYVQVAPKHLIRCCAEQAFRFNQRKGTDRTRFAQVMSNTPGKRVTYKALTAKKEPLVGEAR